MIIINNQHINFNLAKKILGATGKYEFILIAMDQSQEVFNYPNASLLGFSVQLRHFIVESSLKLAESDVKFATFYGSRCNDAYWALTREGGFLLRPSVRPSEAILDIFKNGKKYAFECATAMIIVLLRAIRDLLGGERFDQLYSRIYLWDWHEQTHLPLVIEPITGSGIPGDILYFKNPDVDPRKSWWQGENAIVLPNNKYYGHGAGVQPFEGILEILNRNRRPGATRSAYLLQRATRIDMSKLYMLSHGEISGWTRPSKSQPLRKRSRMRRRLSMM